MTFQSKVVTDECVMGGNGGWTILQERGAGVRVETLDICDTLDIPPGLLRPPLDMVGLDRPVIRDIVGLDRPVATRDDMGLQLTSPSSSSSIISSIMATLQYGTFLIIAMSSVTGLGSLPMSCLLQVSKVAA